MGEINEERGDEKTPARGDLRVLTNYRMVLFGFNFGNVIVTTLEYNTILYFDRFDMS